MTVGGIIGEAREVHRVARDIYFQSHPEILEVEADHDCPCPVAEQEGERQHRQLMECPRE